MRSHKHWAAGIVVAAACSAAPAQTITTVAISDVTDAPPLIKNVETMAPVISHAGNVAFKEDALGVNKIWKWSVANGALTLVAESGMDADCDGRDHSSFYNHVIQNGRVAFLSFLTGFNEVPQGVYLWNGISTVKLTCTGDVLDATPNNVPVVRVIFGMGEDHQSAHLLPLAINGYSNIYARTREGDPPSTPHEGGNWIVNPTGTEKKIALKNLGDTAGLALPMGADVTTLGTPSQNGGRQIMWAKHAGGSAPDGSLLIFWQGGATGSRSVVFSDGDAAPGAGGDDFLDLVTMASINQRGWIGFNARLAGHDPAAPTPVFNMGVFKGPADSPMSIDWEAVALTGANAPGTFRAGVLCDCITAPCNPQCEGGGPECEGLVPICYDPPPAIATFEAFHDVVLNAADDVAFVATLEHDQPAGGEEEDPPPPLVTDGNDSGVWMEDAGVLELVAREGAGIPGSVFGVPFFSRSEHASAFHDPFINGNGRIAFLAWDSEGQGPTSEGTKGVYMTDDLGVLRKLVRVGDTLTHDGVDYEVTDLALGGNSTTATMPSGSSAASQQAHGSGNQDGRRSALSEVCNSAVFRANLQKDCTGQPMGCQATIHNAAFVGTFDADGECSGLPPSPLQQGDTTGDGVVGVMDMLAVFTRWMTDDPDVDCNGDGVVNGFDLLVVLQNWGRVL